MVGAVWVEGLQHSYDESILEEGMEEQEEEHTEQEEDHTEQVVCVGALGVGVATASEFSAPPAAAALAATAAAKGAAPSRRLEKVDFFKSPLATLC